MADDETGSAERDRKKMRSTVRSKKGVKKVAVAAAPVVADSDMIPMLEDPSLPAGWIRKVIQRQTGKSAGKYDVYLFSPKGRKLRSKSELALYLREINSNLDVNEFDFTVKGKATGQSPANPKRENGQRKNSVSPKKDTRQSSRARGGGGGGGDRAKNERTGQKLVVKLSFGRSQKREAERQSKRASSSKSPTSPQTKTSTAQKDDDDGGDEEGKDEESGEPVNKKTKTTNKKETKGSTSSTDAATEETEKTTRASKRKDTTEAKQKASLPPKKKLRPEKDAKDEEEEEESENADVTVEVKDEEKEEEVKEEENGSDAPATRSSANGSKKEAKSPIAASKKKAQRKKGRAPRKITTSKSALQDPVPGPSGVSLPRGTGDSRPASPNSPVAAAEETKPENGNHEE